MMTDPDIKSLGAINEKIQLRFLFIINSRNSHQFICTLSHIATSVSITMATLSRSKFANVLSLPPLLPFLQVFF